jgi:uncharacterized protein (DUF58 family)
MAFAAVAALGMLAFGYAYDAPWYFLAIAGVTLAMALLAMIANPQTGLRMTRETIHFYHGRHTQDVAVSNIRSARIISHIDAGPSALLTLQSGEKIAIPAMCINGRFADALAKAGVAVE